MDSLIAALARPDGDLIVCEAAGVAYQADMTVTASYDGEYFDKCDSYRGSSVAKAINRGRVELVARHYCPVGLMVDVGIGSGEFIDARQNTYGTDVNQAAIEWLRQRDKLASDLMEYPAFSFWDVIEHIPEPESYFQCIPSGGYLFTSLPIFDDLNRIRESKHYRPGEHLYYWTDDGFEAWMRGHGFKLLERSDFETKAGRESIMSYAFRRQ